MLRHFVVISSVLETFSPFPPSNVYFCISKTVQTTAASDNIELGVGAGVSEIITRYVWNRTSG